jgi:hypothetical protein
VKKTGCQGADAGRQRVAEEKAERDAEEKAKCDAAPVLPPG